MQKNVDSFIEYMVIIRNASENTVSAYRRDLARFVSDMESRGANEPADMTEEMIADYFFELEKSDMAPSTYARHMSCVKTFVSFLVENDDIPRNITDSLMRPKVQKSRPLIMTPEEVDRLLSAPDQNTPMGARDKAILELLYASGLKVGELVALYPVDVDLRASMVRIVSVHESKNRDIPFGEKARDALITWIGKGRERYVPPLESAPLFVNVRGEGLSRQSVWKLVRNYARAAGIRKEITPGVLRHSFAAHLMENGADVRSLTRLMGYSAEAQAALYETDETARLRDVYTKANRRG